jgi:hypothetical protein
LVKNTTLKGKCVDNFEYSEAQEKKDKSFCEKINDQTLKEKCKEEIILQDIESISFSGTVEVCNELKNESKSYCINKINNSKDIENFNYAINNKDLARCNIIINKNLLQSCNDSLNIESAIKNNDINSCNLIFDIEKKEACIANIKTVDEQKIMKNAIDSNNLDSCNQIKDKNLNSKCKDIIYLRIAIEKKEKVNCDYISG